MALNLDSKSLETCASDHCRKESDFMLYKTFLVNAVQCLIAILSVESFFFFPGVDICQEVCMMEGQLYDSVPVEMVYSLTVAQCGFWSFF